MKAPTFRVEYDPQGNQRKPWKVIKSGNTRATSRHTKKSAATRKAKRLAKSERYSTTVKIKKKNGRIQRTPSY